MSRKTEKFTYTDGQYFCNICDEPREGEELAVDCYDACLDDAKLEEDADDGDSEVERTDNPLTSTETGENDLVCASTSSPAFTTMNLKINHSRSLMKKNNNRIL